MKVNSFLQSPGPDVFYTEEFKKVLEDHIQYLKNHPQTTPLEMTPRDSEKWRWNISGYLTTIVPPQHVWIIMRINGFISDIDYDGSQMSLLIPPVSALDDIRQRYYTKHTI